jgi:hypothetical protein
MPIGWFTDGGLKVSSPIGTVRSTMFISQAFGRT